MAGDYYNLNTGKITVIMSNGIIVRALEGKSFWHYKTILENVIGFFLEWEWIVKYIIKGCFDFWCLSLFTDPF